ncbi:MAG TPA: bifunctional 5,10-methylenetetrahydrofolate dehydrogenase/5,10-methenyltetrahydrofolate cyclohydrolase [Erysipelothrix sp.]|nr:bifunctional 5,10-methylenetetrahydrofolate dehydrogenase/5,10-methenyltetrahydrofolate cyclohydrolase [Erysipelothrix sp.]
MVQILSGLEVSKKRKLTLKEEVSKINGRKPKLVVVIVGQDPASETYVASKAKQCIEVGMDSEIIRLDETVSQSDLLAVVNELNENKNVDGILVQFPLPSHCSETEVMAAIAAEKDVDGLNPLNVGLLETGADAFAPCTAQGVITLLKEYNIPMEGRRALVIGRSRLVGKPVATMLLAENATVTIAHSRTVNLEQLIAENDIIVVAIGRAHFIKKDWIKPHHTVVDVGIHRLDGKLVGDVESIENAEYGSPVPKGVGPMTILTLLENTLKAYNNKEESHE